MGSNFFQDELNICNNLSLNQYQQSKPLPGKCASCGAKRGGRLPRPSTLPGKATAPEQDRLTHLGRRNTLGAPTSRSDALTHHGRHGARCHRPSALHAAQRCTACQASAASRSQGSTTRATRRPSWAVPRSFTLSRARLPTTSPTRHIKAHRQRPTTSSQPTCWSMPLGHAAASSRRSETLWSSTRVSRNG